MVKHKILSCYTREGFGWFRILGYGLSWKDTYKNKLSFPERIGKKKFLKIGDWIIRFLPRNKN